MSRGVFSALFSSSIQLICGGNFIVSPVEFPHLILVSLNVLFHLLYISCNVVV